MDTSKTWTWFSIRSLGLGDSVDIHPLEINDENGSLVMIRSDIDSPVTYQIQELKQDGWQILNYTNGAMISLPKGNHAIRVGGAVPNQWGRDL